MQNVHLVVIASVIILVLVSRAHQIVRLHVNLLVKDYVLLTDVIQLVQLIVLVNVVEMFVPQQHAKQIVILLVQGHLVLVLVVPTVLETALMLIVQEYVVALVLEIVNLLVEEIVHLIVKEIVELIHVVKLVENLVKAHVM